MRWSLLCFGFLIPMGGCSSASESSPPSTESTAMASNSATSSGAGGQGGAAISNSSSASGQGGSAGQGGSMPSASCTTTCETKAQLGCAGFDFAECMADCESLAQVAPWCMAVTDPLAACFAAQPASSFECDPEKPAGVTPKSGVCGAQVNAVRDCWFEGPAGGLPDLSAEIAAICSEHKGLPCAEASCASDYMKLIAASAECNGAWAAMFACVAKLPDKQWGCNNGNPKLLNDGGACDFQLALVFACTS